MYLVHDSSNKFLYKQICLFSKIYRLQGFSVLKTLLTIKAVWRALIAVSVRNNRKEKSKGASDATLLHSEKAHNIPLSTMELNKNV